MGKLIDSYDSEHSMSDDGHSDIENNNINKLIENDKDSIIATLKKKLKEMTAKFNKMKADNIKLKSKMKAMQPKSSNNAKPKQKSEKQIAKMKKKYLKKWSARLPKVAGMKKTKFI